MKVVLYTLGQDGRIRREDIEAADVEVSLTSRGYCCVGTARRDPLASVDINGVLVGRPKFEELAGPMLSTDDGQVAIAYETWAAHERLSA